MWRSTSQFRPAVDHRGRNESVWLYDRSGIFLGHYVEFGLDEPVESHEYGDSAGVRHPSHFWDGAGKPAYPPRA